MPYVSAAFKGCAIALILLGLGQDRALGQSHQAQVSGQEAKASKEPTGASSLPPRRSAAEIARWNDRGTPRRMLETFFFAVYCYDLAPELIVNAIDCLDFGKVGKQISEGDAALMAHELSSIVSRQDVALYSLSDDPIEQKAECILVDTPTIHIGLRKQDDGRWRFDTATVERIPRMRLAGYREQRSIQESRMKLAEGRTDPETTMRSFLMDVARRDFRSASRCLDLRDVPLKLRAVRGPELARKLAFVIQRCGFVFPQEIISDPDGWRFIWHSNHRGRVMLDRVRQPDGKDAWLFSRGTLHNLDAMVEGFRKTQPDPRYEFVGVVIDETSLSEGARKSIAVPSGVPSALASARATLRTFLEGMDDLEFDDARTRLVLSCLDLGDTPEADRNSIGLRVAGKLDMVLHHLNIDLLSVPETWDAEPQTFGTESDWLVSLGRQKDGAWRFDADTVARVPEMFERLAPEEKTKKERGSRFGSARQTLRTFLRATADGDDPLGRAGA